MATATLPSIQPKPRIWTRGEYYQMGKLGWFQDQRVELIEGEILEMPPPGNAHCIATENVAEVLRGVFGKGHWVRAQMPLNFSPNSDPLPDVAVVPGNQRDFTEHPTTALVVVEVSDSTLAYDRGRKASLYACRGIADYWIVNLVDGCLEIRRNPAADRTQEYGFGYRNLATLGPSDVATLLAAPQTAIQVADLLP